MSRFFRQCRKIVCVGRNFSEHASELGNAVPTKPMLFLKPPSAFIIQGEEIEIPLGCDELHHEVELGVWINSTCKRVSQAEAMNYVGGYALALDMTARSVQNEAKAKGHPWTMAKCFDTSCPISPFIPKSAIPDPQNVNLVCKVNGQLRQNGQTSDMIFPVKHLISFISDYFTLEEGDLILTGTPAGVGPVRQGDVVEAEIPNVIKMEFGAVKRQ